MVLRTGSRRSCVCACRHHGLHVISGPVSPFRMGRPDYNGNMPAVVCYTEKAEQTQQHPGTHTEQCRRQWEEETTARSCSAIANVSTRSSGKMVGPDLNQVTHIPCMHGYLAHTRCICTVRGAALSKTHHTAHSMDRRRISSAAIPFLYAGVRSRWGLKCNRSLGSPPLDVLPGPAPCA